MKLLLKAGLLIDGTGTTAVSEGAVVIEGDRISKVCVQSELLESDISEAEIIHNPNGT